MEIKTCEDVKTAVAANPESPAERRMIIKHSIDLGCVEQIPDAWEVELAND